MSVIAKVSAVGGAMGNALRRSRFVYRRRVRPAKRAVGTRLRRLTPWVIALAVGGGLAAMIITQTWMKVVGVAVLPLLLWLVFARTYAGVLAIMVLVASFVDEALLPKPVTVGGMGFHTSELLLILAVFAVFARALASKSKSARLNSPMTLPLVALAGSVLLSMAISYVHWLADPSGPFNFRLVYNWARPMFYLFVFFVAAYSLDTEKKLHRAIGILMIVSVIVSVLIIAQQVVGYDQPIFSYWWYRGSGDNPGETPGTVTRLRVEAPGLHTMLTVVLIAFALSAIYRVRHRFWHFMALVTIGVALVVTWQRNYWVAAIIGAIIVSLGLSGRRKLGLILVTLIWISTVSVGFVGLASLSPGSKLTKDMAARLMSVFTPIETLRTSSLQWRLEENRKAIEVIRDNPVFGLGVGNPIMHVAQIRKGRFISEPRYRVHNTYLMLYAVYGLPGVMCTAWLGIAFLLRAYTLLRRSKADYIKVLAVSFIAAYVGFLFRAIFNQFPADPAAIAVLAFILGATEACWQINSRIERASALAGGELGKG